MSFGGGGSIHTEEQRVLSLRVNQSAYGGAKTRVWGKYRVPGNMLDYMDFTSIPHTSQQSSGGKGGGGVTSSNTNYTYTAGVVIGLCTGSIAGVGKVWQSKDITTLTKLGMTLKAGALRQSPWSHLTANYPAKAVTYSGIAYVANNAFDLGSSPNQPNLSFEVFGERIIAGGDDAAAADIIYDIVADPVEGIGLAADVLADTSDYALWCSAMGLSVSVGATSQRASRELIASLLKATMAEAVWSSGKIRIVPYGDEPVGAWTPNTTPAYDLTESDFLEPPRHKRTQPADAINRVTLNYTSRAKDYNTVTVMRDDLTAVTQYGPRPETLDLPCITRDEMAVVVCEFWRNRGLYIRNQWEFVVDERFCLVEAMDLLTLTFGPQHLDHVAVRVVETTDDGAGRITMLVEEWPFGLLKATAIPTQTISGHMPDFNVAPGAVNAPVIFDAPSRQAATGYEIWAAVAGASAHWGGANVWVSTDGATYKQVGVVHGRARYGSLSAPLPAAADPDLANVCTVDLTISQGELIGGTREDADNLLTLCCVGGELIAYESATLIAACRYTLGTRLRRGVYGTVISDHAAGAPFVRLDDALFRYAYDQDMMRKQIWLKFQSFNSYGGAHEELSSVAAYGYTIGGPTGTPFGVAAAQAAADAAQAAAEAAQAAADALAAEAAAKAAAEQAAAEVALIAASGKASVTIDNLGNALVTFDIYDDPQILSYEMREGASFDAGAYVAQTTGNTFTLPVLGNAGKTYWIRAKYETGYSIAGYRIDFSGANMPAPGRPTWSIAEPNLVYTWAAAAGAAQYLCLFEVGGVTTIKVVATPGVSFPIPKYAAAIRIVAIGADGTLSPFVDEEISIAGQYHYNEIVNVALPLTTGQYLNLAFTAANTVKRASLLGNAPVAPYCQNINDGDLYAFGYNLANLAASSVQNISASWFRQGFWREQVGYFESAVVDLGAILTGSLMLNLTKTVTYVGNAPVSGWAHVAAEYLADADTKALIDKKAFLTARFFVATDSPYSASWKEATNGDWITARYVKIVVEVAMASPLTEITVTAGAITIDVPDVSETGSKTGVTSAGQAITFAKSYHSVSCVIATARGAAKAYTGNITATGCTLYVDAGTQQVDYFVKGY